MPDGCQVRLSITTLIQCSHRHAGTAVKAPSVLASASNKSFPMRPNCMAYCRYSTAAPMMVEISATKIAAPMLSGRSMRQRSNKNVPVRPPNIMKCTTLSAPSNRCIPSSPKGCGNSVRYRIAISTTMVG